MRLHFLLFGFFVITCFTEVLAQKKKEESAAKTWDVNAPGAPAKSVSFELEEGTWMNLDVSPDGKQIVFDLLGDIYIMPSEGGSARCLRSGYAFEVQPRFSPDGKYISFTSDAGGADNIWVMDANGNGAKAITNEDYRLLNNAEWTPDGQYLIARKHFTNTRSAGAGELWMYHINGGSGLQLVQKKNDQQDIGEPCVSSNGRYVYYSEDMYPGGYFQYNKDPNSLIYAIRRLDRQTGKIKTEVQGPGGACRPVLSNDNRTLAFVRRVREKSVLYVRDLASGKERPIYTELSKDQQEAWALFGVYTNFSFSPDDRYIYVWAQGKIRKIDVLNGQSSIVPFKLIANHNITEALRFQQETAPDSFTVNTIRHAVTSPNGRRLIFNAVGRLWMKILPDGHVERLTKNSEFEFEPAWSSNNERIAFVSWSDSAMGAVKIYDPAAGLFETITAEKGIYRTPSFSPDGKYLVYLKEEGNDHQGFAHCTNPGIYLYDFANKTHTLLDVEGEYPRFSADSKRIFFQTGGYLFGALEKGFKSCDLTGNQVITHYTSKYANSYALSPDNRYLAFNELFKVYVTPFIQTGKPIDLSSGTSAYPVKLLSTEAGISLHWSDTTQLHWTLGEEYFKTDVAGFFMDDKTAEAKFKPVTKGASIGLKLAHDKPTGIFAYTNARLISMKGDEVIENGTLVVKDNRILSVGPASAVTVPEGAKTVDCSGKTIMPGLVDVHAHLGTFRHGLSPQQQWSYYANLAFGVTTTHDPSSNTEMVFSQSEMVKSGNMIGPRIFSTGIILYGADGDFRAQINNLEDARFALRRTRAFGAFSVKSYNQPRRNQRQQVIAAARELKMNVVPEGGSHFLHNLSMIIDGHTGIEHNLPVHDLYSDVVKLWGASKTGYTPTLIVNYGSVNGEYYYYQNEKVWENQRLLNFTPRALIDPRARHRTMVPDEEYRNGHMHVARSIKKLNDAGVKVNLGAHGQIQGLGAHWELKMLASGGLTNMEALRCATMNGAHYIGMENQIGSLEPGKLADFIVLDENPLDNLDNISTIRYTVANGRLYDAMSMNELITGERKRMPFFFEQEYGNNDFHFHEETGCFQGHTCGCRK